MSFQDLANGSKVGHALERQTPQQDSSFERAIRASVQDLQSVIRMSNNKLEQAQRSRLSNRVSDALDRDIERGEELSEDIRRMFRDWTVHLAGEPSEKLRKKFSYEKLQKAFEEEAAHLKRISLQVSNLQQEMRIAEGKQQSLHEAPGCNAADQYLLADESEALRFQCLTDGKVSSTHVHAAIAKERERNIQRIQCQVTEVNQMFRDFASIVADQGKQFQTIEHQAETAACNSSQAVLELRKAADRQRNSRGWLWVLFGIVIMLLCFVVIPQTHMMTSHLELAGPEMSAHVANKTGFLAIKSLGRIGAGAASAAV